MSTLAVIKNEGNIRSNPSQQANKNKPMKVHSPKIRLRLQEACDNMEKAHVSNVKHSLNPKKSNLTSNLTSTEQESGSYLSGNVINRNKICQMDKIMFPTASDKQPYDKPPARCLGKESLSYLHRSRGSLVIVGSGEGRVVPDEIHIRCPTREAENNLEKGRGLRMMNVLQHSSDFTDDQPQARLRDEVAAEISRKHQGGSMSDLMHHDRKFECPSAREPRCPTVEALETYNKSRGDSMSLVMGNKIENEQFMSASCPKKRVKDENGNEIEPMKSYGMSQVMNSNDKNYTTETYVPRVRLDGKDIADKHRGTLTDHIKHYNQIEPGEITRPEPRVLRQGKEFANASSGRLIKLSLEKFGEHPRESKPKARVTQYSQKIAHISKGGAMRDALCPPRQAHSKRHVRSAHT